MELRLGVMLRGNPYVFVVDLRAGPRHFPRLCAELICIITGLYEKNDRRLLAKLRQSCETPGTNLTQDSPKNNFPPPVMAR